MGRETIGMICPPDHEVFAGVAGRLRAQGYGVTFLEPGVELPRERLDRLDLLVNKKVRWESLDALAYAHRAGIPAWNDYVATATLLNRLSQLAALEVAGFPTPAVSDEPPDGEGSLDGEGSPGSDYVAKGLFDIDDDPVVNGEGDLYQPLLPFDGTDDKYYVVDDGEEVQTAVVRFESKLFGQRECLGRGTVDPSVERRLRRLLRFTGARALGVDVVTVDGEPYAVDVNPATSFRRTGLTDALVASIADVIE
jgi:glutathione synthase/RimK-type ligase-like ATP-grasp enzyme